MSCFATCLPEFDPDLDAGATASAELDACGGQGRPCCAAPNEPCQGVLLCSPETQLCVRQPVLLCSDDAECRAGEVCCSAGLVGTCEAVAREDCAALDLLASTPVLDGDPIELRQLDPEVESDRCLIDRGCVGGAGVRRLLRVATTVTNVGGADLLLGSPDDTLAPTVTTCGGEPRFAAFLRYELVDASSTQATRDVPASCSTSSSQLALPFDCDFQGLWSGFSQVYAPATFGEPSDDCRWLDITDVLPGDYTLRVTVNPDGQLPEANRGNNTPSELPITVPAFGPPSSPCPQPANPLLGSGSRRECGWVRADAANDAPGTPCVPGEEVLFDCSSDDPEFICGDYRACDGAESCPYKASLQTTSAACYYYVSGNASLYCPASGSYSLWLPGDSTDHFTCVPLPVDSEPIFEPEGAPDAGLFSP
jgi:lysyl oxidase